MECTWPESLPSSKKKGIEELVQGHDIANQLLCLIRETELPLKEQNWNLKSRLKLLLCLFKKKKRCNLKK
nr:hypothetical protein CFP56_25588 [Quercus suber]